MTEAVRHLPCESYTSMPWRNGAGTTREIVREPMHAEGFAWRLSLATVAASGPFSSYPGYQRAVALIEGRGFRLDIKDVGTQVLAARGEHVLFSGAAEARCELLGGACTDLSLMVREPGGISAVTRLHIGADQTLPTHAGALQVLFVLHGAIECRAPAALPEPGLATRPYRLNTNDTLLIRGSAERWSLRQTSADSAELLAITFRPATPEMDKSEALGTHAARTATAKRAT
jgi:environmental stress-induced protein Ves